MTIIIPRTVGSLLSRSVRVLDLSLIERKGEGLYFPAQSLDAQILATLKFLFDQGAVRDKALSTETSDGFNGSKGKGTDRFTSLVAWQDGSMGVQPLQAVHLFNVRGLKEAEWEKHLNSLNITRTAPTENEIFAVMHPEHALGR